MRLPEAQIASDRSDATNSYIRNVGTERGKRWNKLANDWVTGNLAVCTARADLNLIRIIESNAIKSGNPFDVNEPICVDDAHLHRQQQLSSTGVEHAVTGLSGCAHGVRDRRRPFEFEG
jgi:hypothetical protein